MNKGLFDLTGKWALVTGGNSGLGLAFLRGMARQGSNAIVWGRDESKNRGAVDELRALGVEAFSQTVDVADEAAVVRGFEDAVSRVGKLDTVVQNAGFSNPARSFAEMTTGMWRQQMAVALDGGFFTLREAARHMTAAAEAGKGGGSIMLTGSGTVFGGIPGMEHYGAAKAGLAAIMRGMATELGPHGIRVNMVAVGYVKTDISEGRMDEMFRARTPVRRVGSVSDVEAIAAYLACDAASFHTGDVINVDGGFRASYF